ncbi:hypothetical protein KUTeg_023776 [Tegillarca granosa]|uniref:MD-2-related lipid-recognition domain-containing protein n=1 Tax=Tegillarca granosa TaxID=220873 RepID=A0ABQ9E5K1_TEGGR|nr:hypothetical protein KUTeg_023776 [Tegillarca granosa]
MDYQTRDDLNKMDFLTMCIKEGIRRWAPVPSLERISTEEITIDNITYPPGTSFGVSLEFLHNNPDIWNDPKKFDPQRFSKDNICDIKPFSFCPFSAGPRYTISLDPSHVVVKICAGVTMPATGIKVFVKKRKCKENNAKSKHKKQRKQ